VESRLRCAVGSSDGSDGEINHFFAYDERAFQRGALHALAFPEHSILPPSVCYEPIPIPLPTLRGQLNSLKETHSNLHQDFQSSRPCPSAEPLEHKNRFPCSDLTSVPSTWRYRYLCELSIFLTCVLAAQPAPSTLIMPLRSLNHVSNL
jgi:hypothetical protein